jgi:4-amino-4-deoxy-L-arabinose transferase-like glycosyltransferase
MPVVAVGEAVPPPQERSLYSTHPPGLVWLLGAAFVIGGESEVTARSLAIVASLASMALLLRLTRRGGCGHEGLLTCALYALMPMAVYFGRMVDQETFCLMFMLAALVAWQSACRAAGQAHRGPGLSQPAAWTLAGLSTAAAMWIDWAGVVFAGVMSVAALVHAHRRRAGRVAAIAFSAWVAVAVAMLVTYIVYAGFEGRWSDLDDVFLSRATESARDERERTAAATLNPWQNTVDNLTWPLIGLAAAGLIVSLVARRRGRSLQRPDQTESASAGPAEPPIPAMIVLAVTGLVWVLAFWPQYGRHHYWLYYLGPVAASLAGRGLHALFSRSRPVAWIVFGVTALVCFVVTDRFYAYEKYAEPVKAWRALAQAVGPGRLLLYRDMAYVERRGGYVLRNIVPPQFAYYLDRAYDVESDFNEVVRRMPEYEGFAISVPDALRNREGIALLRQRFRDREMFGLVLFESPRAQPIEQSTAP